MTSIEQYQENLKEIVQKYKIKDVLELGVEKGLSTKVFLTEKINLISIDMIYTDFSFDAPDWRRITDDVSKVIREMVKHEKKFDLVFGDITYYTGKAKYGTTKAYNIEFKKLMKDLPYYYKLVKDGGLLIMNDYVNQNGQRSAVKDVVNNFMILQNKPFLVYPTRGGMAVIQK